MILPAHLISSINSYITAIPKCWKRYSRHTESRPFTLRLEVNMPFDALLSDHARHGNDARRRTSAAIQATVGGDA